MPRIKIRKPVERSLYEEGYAIGFAEGRDAAALSEEFLIRNLRAELEEERMSRRAVEATNKVLQTMNDRLLHERDQAAERSKRGVEDIVSHRRRPTLSADPFTLSMPEDKHADDLERVARSIPPLRECNLTDWERNFLDSIERRVSRGISLSFGQKESWTRVLDKYYHRIGSYL